MAARSALSPPTITRTLGILFIVPLVLVWALSYLGRSVTQEVANNGKLIQPAIDLSALNLHYANGQDVVPQDIYGHWTLLYVEPKNCENQCQLNLVRLRQVHLALGQEYAEQVQRALLMFTAQPTVVAMLNKEYPQVHYLTVAPNQFAESVSHTASEDSAMEKGGIYLVDPQGNIIMNYAANATPDDILSDMKQLLKMSPAA